MRSFVSVPAAQLSRAAMPARKCVVLGIGNSLLCDDGVGIRLVRELGERDWGALRREGIELDFVDGGTLGFLLIDRVAGAELIVVVDAANLGGPAGSFQLLEGDELHEFLSDRKRRSVHEVGLIDLIQMLDLTPERPKELALIGVQPERLEWGLALSDTLEARLPEIIDFVSRFIDEWSARAALPSDARLPEAANV